jgi:1,4-alpha-glucan branching enzyme
MDRKPFVVCPYDAELFGHWWFEGPEWLDQLFREARTYADTLQFITASDYLATYRENQSAIPSLSSWGDGGYAEVWLDESSDWVYPHLLRIAERMEELVEKFPRVTGLHRRALNQAAREILLSQASDWAFIMKAGTAVDYAVRRTREHIENFNRIYESLLANRLDVAWLSTVEARNNLFPDMDYRIMRLSGEGRD